MYVHAYYILASVKKKVSFVFECFLCVRIYLDAKMEHRKTNIEAFVKKKTKRTPTCQFVMCFTQSNER